MLRQIASTFRKFDRRAGGTVAPRLITPIGLEFLARLIRGGLVLKDGECGSVLGTLLTFLRAEESLPLEALGPEIPGSLRPLFEQDNQQLSHKTRVSPLALPNRQAYAADGRSALSERDQLSSVFLSCLRFMGQEVGELISAIAVYDGAND